MKNALSPWTLSLLCTLSLNHITAHAADTPDETTSTDSSSVNATQSHHSFEYRNMKDLRIRASKKSSETESNLWSTLDPKSDHIVGTSTEKVYQHPRFPKASKEITVAVIDGGIDIHHEDLQGKIWVNRREIPENGIDDDQNGFIDDVHGWNFIGNKNGENIHANTLELTREVVRMTQKNKKTPLLGAELLYFKKIKAQYKKELQYTKNDLKTFTETLEAILLLKNNGLTDESMWGVLMLPSNDPAVKNAKAIAMSFYLNSNGATSDDLMVWIEDLNAKINYGYNLQFDSSKIIGDDPEKLNEIGYGNHDVIGPDAYHGTHVAGIIAANRDNQFGILGQADEVKIMAIRAVPNGDERDKDVANAIIYAVNNGAQVINMSFGKEFSPQKHYVDKAVEFAEKRGVILIHAAGNNGKNTESGKNNFPNKKLHRNTAKSHEALNWIEVGASNKKKDETLIASFSNWGKTSVDLFAPGVKINSTIPGNAYDEFDGTSMAAPEVAGITALLLAHFSNKSPLQVIHAIMNSTSQYPKLLVNLPYGNGKRVNFSHLSKTGGVVNAFNAMNALLK